MAYKRRGRGEKLEEIQKKRKSDQSESRKKIIRNPRVNLRVFEQYFCGVVNSVCGDRGISAFAFIVNQYIQRTVNCVFTPPVNSIFAKAAVYSISG